MIWRARSFPRVAGLKLVFMCTGDECLRESLEWPKGSSATYHVRCEMRDGSGANAAESGFISSLFGVYRDVLCSCGDISVLLDL